VLLCFVTYEDEEGTYEEVLADESSAFESVALPFRLEIPLNERPLCIVGFRGQDITF
jgi:hypothetical protein